MGRVVMGADRRVGGWRKPPKNAASVGHALPPVREGQRPHDLLGACWCNPIVEISGRQQQIVHRDIDPPDEPTE